MCRSYLIFTSLPYRIMVYAALPAVLAALGFCVGMAGLGDAGVMLAAALLPSAEILSDYWFLGGIQTGDMEKLDYLKTSGQGRRVMQDALVFDLIRKLLTALGSLVLCVLALRLWKDWGQQGRWQEMGTGVLGHAGIFDWDFAGSMGWFPWSGMLLYLVLLSWFLSVLGTFLSRYSGLIWMNMTIGYGATALAAAAGLVGILLWRYSWGLAAMGGTGALPAGVLAVKAAMKKVEESYYDT